MSKSATLKLVDQKAVEIGMDEEARKEISEALATFLADTYTLYQKSLYYHWNVTGPNFVGLHELFEQHYTNLHQAGDDLAERIRALGHMTPGTQREFLALSSIEEDETLPESWQAMTQNLLKSHQLCSQQARKVLKTSEKHDDEVTIDMMVQRMTFHDKSAWMLRSLLESGTSA